MMNTPPSLRGRWAVPRALGGGLAMLVAAMLAATLLGPALSPAAAAGSRVPAAVAGLPSTTRQAIRVVRTNQWCSRVYCTRVEAWQRNRTGAWQPVLINGKDAVRAQIGPNGFAPAGEKRQGDGRTPTGVFGIETTFSTDAANPGVDMTWRQRKPTTSVSSDAGYYYNTWTNRSYVRDGARPAMRYGFWINYNNARLRAGVGPRPRPGYGSGIFLHVVTPTDRYGPSQGCVVARESNVQWLLFWLHRGANPRVVLNR